jgi:hypothetical protein
LRLRNSGGAILAAESHPKPIFARYLAKNRGLSPGFGDGEAGR